MNDKKAISPLQQVPPRLTAEKARQVLSAGGLTVSTDQAAAILQFLYLIARVKN